MNDKVRGKLDSLPDSPGVYLHKDKDDKVIYVGKANSLKKRVRQYFQSSKNHDLKVATMVSHIADFEFINTASEMEAFILESNLIKEYMPKYNVLLRDDKTYPYIKITLEEDYPRLLKTRELYKDGSKYYGPYSDVAAVNQMIDFLNEVFKLKRCSKKEFSTRHRACLNYHINGCDGICSGKVTVEEYKKKITALIDFLDGKDKELDSYLKSKMKEHSENLEYEDAARYRDYYNATKTLREKQRVVLKAEGDIDIIVNSNLEEVLLFAVRDHKLIGRETFKMENSKDLSSEPGSSENNSLNSEIITEFIRQHYGSTTKIPKTILVSQDLPEVEILKEYLSDMAGRKVEITRPQRGEKKALLDLAMKDIEKLNKSRDSRNNTENKRNLAIRNMIENILDKKNIQGKESSYRDSYRIESFDISNTNGAENVGGMVVFQGSKSAKKFYRKFKIKSQEGIDDYGAMQEVVYRRLQRGIKGDEAFLPFPDLIFVDGGKGHVTAVEKIVDTLKLEIPVVGMVKDDKHRTERLLY
ncbi:MAG: excinuclease ABC subunit UvrC, partial [Anaerovoracaceae bacterium]